MKILVLRFSSIGDIVLTTPVLRCLKKQLGAELHFLTKNAYTGILSSNPNVDRVWGFDKNPGDLFPALKAERFDWVIDLHHNLRSLRVKLALGRPARSFDKLNLEKWLLVNLHVDRLPRVHIVHRYMDTVRLLGVEYDGQGLDFFIPADQEVDVSALVPGVLPGQYVAFVLGATHATKRLPLEKTIEICRLIRQPVLLLGGKMEAETGDLVAEKAGRQVHNLCGQLNLHQSASIIRQSARVLTHDTGLMHIAAAFRKEIVSVWGNTVPEFGMYPFYPEGVEGNTSVEVTGLPCRPCSKIGYARCPKGHFKCMKEIDNEEVIHTLTSPLPPSRGG